MNFCSLLGYSRKIAHTHLNTSYSYPIFFSLVIVAVVVFPTKMLQ